MAVADLAAARGKSLDRIDRLQNYGNFTSLASALKSSIQRTAIRTCEPGEVELFDPSTRRAQVKFTLDRLQADGTRISRSPVLDVPVLLPSTKEFAITLPLLRGDPVWIMFSQRGLEDWKREYKRSAPTVGNLFSTTDAIAIPGFGSIELIPANEHALCIQTNDGNTSIQVENNRVRIFTGKGRRVDINDENITVSGHAINVQGGEGNINIRTSGSGNITIGNSGTGRITLEATGANIEVKAANNHVRLGSQTDHKRLATEDFVMNVYNGHTHTAAFGTVTSGPNRNGNASHMTSITTAD